MMLTKDDYGQVHNSPETYKALAEALQDHEITGDPQIFEWVDERMSRFTLLLYLGENPRKHWEQLLYVGVEGYGFYGFPCQQLDPGSVASRLKLALGSAEPLADLLNGVLGNLFPYRGIPAGTVVQEWADGGTGPDKREYRTPDIDIKVVNDE
jgi:hypothetical protein